MPINDTTRLHLENCLYRLLGEFLQAGFEWPVRAEVQLGDVAAVLQIGTVGEMPTASSIVRGQPRNDCERDVLRFFREILGPGERLQAGEVIEGMGEAGFNYGPATIRKGLSRLVRGGALTNGRNRRGYGLPD